MLNMTKNKQQERSHYNPIEGLPGPHIDNDASKKDGLAPSPYIGRSLPRSSKKNNYYILVRPFYPVVGIKSFVSFLNHWIYNPIVPNEGGRYPWMISSLIWIMYHWQLICWIGAGLKKFPFHQKFQTSWFYSPIKLTHTYKMGEAWDQCCVSNFYFAK